MTRAQTIRTSLLCLAAAAFSLMPHASASTTDAQSPTDKSQAYIAKQREMLIDAGISGGCHTRSGPDEIVVCGRGIDQSVRTIPPPETGGPKQVKLAAPANGSVGVGVTATGCFLQKCPKKFVLIDLTAIPEAPAGSDADLIARGEMRDR